MSGGASFQGKTNTFRLLQQEVVRSFAERKNSSTLKSALNPAYLILLVVAALATYGTIDLALKTDSMTACVITLVIQTCAVVIFFISPKYDWLTIRLLLLAYLFFYTDVLLIGNGMAAAPYWMFTYILFAFVGVGAIEAFVWIGLHFSLLLIALWLDQNGTSPTITQSTISIIIIAYLLVTAFAYLLAFTSRIIARRMNEQRAQIEVANARYSTILNSAGEGLIAFNEKGIVEFINKHALNLLGIQKSQAIGGKFSTVLPLRKADIKLSVDEHPVAAVLKTGEVFETTQGSKDYLQLARAQRASISIAITVSPIKVGGKLRGAIALFRDASVEEQINQTKGEFVSIASHQLRTPLNVTNWYVEKLLNEKRGTLNSKQKSYVHEIAANNLRMSQLVSDLLTVSRLELGRTVKKNETVNLHERLETLCAEVRPLLIQKHIDLDITLGKKLSSISNSDVSLVTVILQNLLSNAVKYTPEKGVIQVRLHEVPSGEVLYSKEKLVAPQQGYVVSVKDSGIGIPSSEQDKIFSKMYRANNAIQVDVGGNGLGLYVSRGFAQALGGFLWFISEENRGSEFSVYLPQDHTEHD